jgi:preprotein translocase subunit SecY
MAIVPHRPHPAPRAWARIAVTLAALAVYRLGAHIPLAGIDPSTLAEFYRATPTTLAIERISVFLLGVWPIVSVLMLLEAGRLLSRRLDDWATGQARTWRLGAIVLSMALLLTAVQAFGITRALEDIRHLIVAPGTEFRLGIMTTLVAATALLWWLAELISRHGLGNGIWLLLVTPYLAELPGLVWAAAAMLQERTMSAGGLLAPAAFALAAIAVIVWLGRALSEGGMALDRLLILPVLLAAFAASLLTVLLGMLPPGLLQQRGLALLRLGGAPYIAALAVLTFLIALAQWPRARLPSATAGPAASWLVIPTALVLAALMAVPEIIAVRLSQPMLIDGRWLTIIVVIALGALDLLRPPGTEVTTDLLRTRQPR